MINNAEETSQGKKQLFLMIIKNIIDLEERILSDIQELIKK